ncbi:MAG: glycosyltransferase family 4 protein [Nanoarchaeota archaeon]|nr:glycosyltransferase family 4 protein [Nanoarchaeota archaeon]
MKNKILFLGRFVPPIHGASVMNEIYFNSLGKKFNVKKIKLNSYNSLEDMGKLNLNTIFFQVVGLIKTIFLLTFFRPNIIYFEIAPSGIALFKDSTYVLLCKLFRRKIIFASHSRGLSSKNNKDSKYYNFIFRKTKMIILSELLFPEVKALFKTKDTYILPNGIKDETSTHELERIISKRKKEKKTNFLFLSNMIEEKGALDVLKFCNIIKKKKINFNCFFVGVSLDPTFEKIWNKELKKLRLERNCFYLGPKYGKEKNKIIANTDFLIFPTKYKMECYPLVILEALMYGIPVLSYDTGAIKDIIIKDFLGYVSSKKTPEDLVDNFLKIKNKVNRKKIRKYFKDNYTADKSEVALNKIILKELK